MKLRLTLLIIGTLILWILLAIPARLLGGEEAVICSAAAALLCLLPTAATLAWSFWGLSQSPETQLMTTLGGTGLRIFVVLGTAWLVSVAIPYLQQPSYWIWVLTFYLLTLALEIVLLLFGRPGLGPKL